jgi:ribosomal protein S26
METADAGASGASGASSASQASSSSFSIHDYPPPPRRSCCRKHLATKKAKVDKGHSIEYPSYDVSYHVMRGRWRMKKMLFILNKIIDGRPNMGQLKTMVETLDNGEMSPKDRALHVIDIKHCLENKHAENADKELVQHFYSLVTEEMDFYGATARHSRIVELNAKLSKPSCVDVKKTKLNAKLEEIRKKDREFNKKYACTIHSSWTGDADDYF